MPDEDIGLAGPVGETACHRNRGMYVEAAPERVFAGIGRLAQYIKGLELNDLRP